MINKPVIYVVVNKSLNMSPGKVAAQVGHAVALVMAEYSSDQGADLWVTQSHKWLVVLEAENGERLHYLSEYLFDRLVPHQRVIDEGVNEIPAFSLTAVGVGILDKDSGSAKYLSGLKTYAWDPHVPSKERTEIWNDAVTYMNAKPLLKRIFTKL